MAPDASYVLELRVIALGAEALGRVRPVAHLVGCRGCRGVLRLPSLAYCFDATCVAISNHGNEWRLEHCFVKSRYGVWRTDFNSHARGHNDHQLAHNRTVTKVLPSPWHRKRGRGLLRTAEGTQADKA